MMNYSFIIPVYNCRSHLAACVDSIRAVGVEDLEILLIDDGSTDGGGIVCDELAAAFPEVRVVHQANAGASAARNRGLREARGEYVLFVDADDSIDAHRLGKILADQRVRENDLTIFGMSFDYYRRGKCYRQDPLYHRFDGVMDREAWGGAFLALFGDNSLSPIWNKVFRRELIRDAGLELDTSLFLYEDFEFVLRYLGRCRTIWNVPQAVYHYRQSEDEGNAGRRLKRLDSIPELLAVIEKALDAMPSQVSEEARAAVLQQLHLMLAREKIAVSDLGTIRRICRDYRCWTQGRQLPMDADSFQNLLMEEKASALYLRNKKSRMRHWAAVRVKGFLAQLRGMR